MRGGYARAIPFAETANKRLVNRRESNSCGHHEDFSLQARGVRKRTVATKGTGNGTFSPPGKWVVYTFKYFR
jgi:hypothetical protein